MYDEQYSINDKQSTVNYSNAAGSAGWEIRLAAFPGFILILNKQPLMNRRSFLRAGSLTGMGLTGLRSLQAPAMATGRPSRENDFPAPELEEISIARLQESMNQGKASAVSLTKAYLKRIRAIDQQGPALNAVIELNPDAVSIAETLDRERAQGKIRGPLHGIPILVKDNINTGDRMMTTAGSLALSGYRAAADAFIVQRLREAGVVLLGKTNLSEWANFRSSHSTSAWSSRGGQTKCPYILDRNPSGSSSGSGSAAAASLCAVAVGTETDGSIVSPASVNGLVGIKPTVGLWSRSGIIPISATQDTAGPMARTVSDAAILLGAATGEDPADPVTQENRGKALKDYTVFLDRDGLKGKRIGMERSHLNGGNPGLVTLLRAAIRVLEAQGATIVETDVLGALSALGHAEFQVLLYEFKDGLNRYFASAASTIGSLKALIAFNRENGSATMPFFGQDTLIESESKGDLHTKEYTDALAATLGFRKTISDLMAAERLDALSGITNGPACCIDLVNGDYDNGPSLSTPAAITGFPHITVPMGLLHDLPVGISFYGTAYSEPALIAMAYAYEQASGQRRKPAFRANLLG
jgi:amidase